MKKWQFNMFCINWQGRWNHFFLVKFTASFSLFLHQSLRQILQSFISQTVQLPIVFGNVMNCFQVGHQVMASLKFVLTYCTRIWSDIGMYICMLYKTFFTCITTWTYSAFEWSLLFMNRGNMLHELRSFWVLFITLVTLMLSYPLMNTFNMKVQRTFIRTGHTT